MRLPGGQKVAVDQVLYNLTRRGIEFDLLPRCVGRGLPVMAYSPLEQGRMLADPVLVRIATEYGASPAQIALAWVLRQPLVLAIPKASSPHHVQECHRALDVRLTPRDLAAHPQTRARGDLGDSFRNSITPPAWRRVFALSSVASWSHTG
jgi:diketogulonate reductase-like aldo/keto reductase